MAGAIAFYSMVSMAPLLVVAISIAGLFVAEAVVEERVLTAVAEIFSQKTADFLAGVIEAAFRSDVSGHILAIAGLFVVIFFASTVFNSMKLALNTIWGVSANSRSRSGLFAVLWNRLLASAMVLLTAVALTLTMLTNVVSVEIPMWFVQRWPDFPQVAAVYQQGMRAGLVFVAGMIMVAYKVLPDVPLTWRQVLPGALLVTVLFRVGNEVMQAYFSLSVLPTIYGAAGSLVMILLWVYYQSYIFFLGALFTRAYVQHVHWGPNESD